MQIKEPNHLSDRQIRLIFNHLQMIVNQINVISNDDAVDKSYGFDMVLGLTQGVEDILAENDCISWEEI